MFILIIICKFLVNYLYNEIIKIFKRVIIFCTFKRFNKIQFNAFSLNYKGEFVCLLEKNSNKNYIIFFYNHSKFIKNISKETFCIHLHFGESVLDIKQKNIRVIKI